MSLGLASQERDVFHQGQFINIQSKGACEDSYEILLEHRVTHWTGNLLSHSDELCHVTQNEVSNHQLDRAKHCNFLLRSPTRSRSHKSKHLLSSTPI